MDRRGKSKKSFERLLPTDQTLYKRSLNWSQLFDRFKDVNDEEDEGVNIADMGCDSDEIESVNNTESDESVDVGKFEDDAEDDAEFDVKNTLDKTMPVIAERKHNWQKAGIDNVLDTFDAQKIHDKVGNWLVQSNLANNQNKYTAGQRNFYHAPPNNYDSDDSLHSVDTAKYILSNRKVTKTNVTKMTIETYCFSNQHKMLRNERYQHISGEDALEEVFTRGHNMPMFPTFQNRKLCRAMSDRSTSHRIHAERQKPMRRSHSSSPTHSSDVSFRKNYKTRPAPIEWPSNKKPTRVRKRPHRKRRADSSSDSSDVSFASPRKKAFTKPTTQKETTFANGNGEISFRPENFFNSTENSFANCSQASEGRGVPPSKSTLAVIPERSTLESTLRKEDSIEEKSEPLERKKKESPILNGNRRKQYVIESDSSANSNPKKNKVRNVSKSKNKKKPEAINNQSTASLASIKEEPAESKANTKTSPQEQHTKKENTEKNGEKEGKLHKITHKSASSSEKQLPQPQPVNNDFIIIIESDSSANSMSTNKKAKGKKKAEPKKRANGQLTSTDSTNNAESLGSIAEEPNSLQQEPPKVDLKPDLTSSENSKSKNKKVKSKEPKKRANLRMSSTDSSNNDRIAGSLVSLTVESTKDVANTNPLPEEHPKVDTASTSHSNTFPQELPNVDVSTSKSKKSKRKAEPKKRTTSTQNDSKNETATSSGQQKDANQVEQDNKENKKQSEISDKSTNKLESSTSSQNKSQPKLLSRKKKERLLSTESSTSANFSELSKTKKQPESAAKDVSVNTSNTSFNHNNDKTRVANKSKLSLTANKSSASIEANTTRNQLQHFPNGIVVYSPDVGSDFADCTRNGRVKIDGKRLTAVLGHELAASILKGHKSFLFEFAATSKLIYTKPEVASDDSDDDPLEMFTSQGKLIEIKQV